MIKNLLKIFLYIFIYSTFIIMPTFAFEDCVIMTKGKLTDIRIEDNTIIDVYPLITIMNEKNTLIVHPLKLGKTKFSTIKNNKEKIVFNVTVEENKTIIDEIDGFSILQIDEPPTPEEFDLDLPPIGIGEYKD